MTTENDMNNDATLEDAEKGMRQRAAKNPSGLASTTKKALSQTSMRYDVDGDDPLYGDTHLFPPTDPLIRRFKGCGRDSPAVSARHESPSSFLMTHYAWDFLTITDRRKMGSISPIFRSYAQIRQDAMTTSVGYLRQPRPPPDPAQNISKRRAHHMAVMLLRYNFVYADFIRSFGGRYTYQKRNFDSIWSLVESVQHTKPPKGYPTIDFDHAFRALTEGVPLAGDYVCGFCTVSRRNTYDNHSTILLD
jgi:hypothetical protein